MAAFSYAQWLEQSLPNGWTDLILMISAVITYGGMLSFSNRTYCKGVNEERRAWSERTYEDRASGEAKKS